MAERIEVAREQVTPLRVSVITEADAYPDAYYESMKAPVTFGHDATVVVFDRTVLEAPLAGAIPEVAKATDRISEQYIESLDGTAYLVGFSDQSNFSRAFKRWTGTSPRQFQERHRRDAGQI